MRLDITVDDLTIAGLEPRNLKSELTEVLTFGGIAVEELHIEMGKQTCVKVDGGDNSPVVQEVESALVDVINGMRLEEGDQTIFRTDPKAIRRLQPTRKTLQQAS